MPDGNSGPKGEPMSIDILRSKVYLYYDSSAYKFIICDWEKLYHYRFYGNFVKRCQKGYKSYYSYLIIILLTL